MAKTINRLTDIKRRKLGAGFRGTTELVSGAIVAVLVAGALTLPAAAADKPRAIPGGQLDTAISGSDVYIGTPKAADPGDNRACRHAKTYFDTEGAGKYGDLATLF